MCSRGSTMGTTCMLLKTNSGVPLSPAREKSLTFFAFEQQQMGNWPTNCCNDLGLPISAGSF